MSSRQSYHKQWYKLDSETNPEKWIWLAARGRARRSGIDFDIEVTDIVIPDICPILQVKLQRLDKKAAPSLDRVDNSKGYVKGNVRVISTRANTMKGDMSIQDIERLSAYAKGELPY